MVFKHIMKDLVGTRVAVVMTDEACFRGIVRAADEGVIILESVEETSVKDVKWEECEGGEMGYHHWVTVELPKVYLNVGQISRIWPWPVQKGNDEKREYIYLREQFKVI